MKWVNIWISNYSGTVRYEYIGRYIISCAVKTSANKTINFINRRSNSDIKAWTRDRTHTTPLERWGVIRLAPILLFTSPYPAMWGRHIMWLILILMLYEFLLGFPLWESYWWCYGKLALYGKQVINNKSNKALIVLEISMWLNKL